jgi:hypothetical protein
MPQQFVFLVGWRSFQIAEGRHRYDRVAARLIFSQLALQTDNTCHDFFPVILKALQIVSGLRI